MNVTMREYEQLKYDKMCHQTRFASASSMP